MGLSKTLLLLGLVFLVVSSMVFAETSQENSQVDLDDHHDGRGGYNGPGHGYEGGRGGYNGGGGKGGGKGRGGYNGGGGKGGGKGRGGYGKPGHRGRHPPSETEEGN